MTDDYPCRVKEAELLHNQDLGEESPPLTFQDKLDLLVMSDSDTFWESLGLDATFDQMEWYETQLRKAFSENDDAAIGRVFKLLATNYVDYHNED